MLANSLLHVQQEKGGDDGLSCRSSSRLIKLPCGDQSTNLLHDLLSLEEFPNPWISTCDLSRRHTNSSISGVFNPSNSSGMNRISTNPCTDSPSITVMSSNDTTVGSSSRVPFKWEEAPGKPAAASTSIELITNTNQPCLQLPPKLQGPPLFLDHSPYQSPSRLHPPKLALNQPTNHKTSLNHLSNQPIDQRISLNHPSIRLTSNHPKLKNLCKFLLKTASWSQPLHNKPAAHAYSQSWSSSSPATSNRAHHDDQHRAHHDAQQDDLAINHRFFFDKSSPKDLKYSVSMDCCRKPALPLYQDYRRQDELVSKEALSFLAMEEELDEAEYSSTASTPWQPINFDDERKGCGCSPWPPIRPNTVVQKRLEGDDEEEDEGFHDFFSTDSNSIEKPSQRTDDSMDSACSSPCPWYLQFGPEEEEVEEERNSGRKLIVRLVAIVKLKKMISSKVCKIKKRRGGTSSQLNTTSSTSMWSPTLATYLYNQQKEERESLDHPPLQQEQEEDDVHSNTSSNRLHIDPNYYLPSSIMGHYSPNCSSSEEEKNPSHHLKLATIMPSNFSQEEEEVVEEEEENEPSQFSHKLRLDGDGENEPSPLTHKWRFEEEDANELSPLPHRLSLREQLVEFEDDYPIHLLQSIRSSPKHPQVLDIKTREVTPCKRLCKVQKRVKMLVATIKLIFVQTEVRERKGPQRTTTKYGSCINPMLSQLPSTNK